MVKVKSIFVCQECGNQSPQWLGKCPNCNSWNTFVEETKGDRINPRRTRTGISPQPKPVNQITSISKRRYKTGIIEIDRLIGGGIVEGSFILIGGAPGIGKSTLLLQIAKRLAGSGEKCLYISGEESPEQLKIRAERLDAISENILVYSGTDIEDIIQTIEENKPSFVFVDSIQTVFHPDVTGSPGSVIQIRESADRLMFLAKSKNIPIFISGQITKEGAIAGPKVLEHMVDVVMYFEGARDTLYRVLRVEKNRFGIASEIALFAMEEGGLREILNPSEILLESRSTKTPGSCIVSAMEGTRPLLVEIQALISRSSFTMPRRQISGLDYNRALLLLAVLEKRMGINLSQLDVFINVVGGVRIQEPACDLGTVSAVYSVYKNMPVEDTVLIGEVGLGGEIRSVTLVERRVGEAEKLGFKRVIVPHGSIKNSVLKSRSIEIVEAEDISEAFQKVFSKR